VPGANDALTKLCNEWAAKEKVDLKVDFITSQGDKLLLTITSEAQAKSGHDILAFGTWYVTAQARNLEPVDDIVQSLIAQYGAPAAAIDYLGKQDGRWVAVPVRSAARAYPGAALKLGTEPASLQHRIGGHRTDGNGYADLLFHQQLRSLRPGQPKRGRAAREKL